MRRGFYRHFKGRYYEVLGVARHSESLEEMVVYKALYKHKNFGHHSLWVRPAGMFLEFVRTAGGGKVRRFAPVTGPEKTRAVKPAR